MVLFSADASQNLVRENLERECVQQILIGLDSSWLQITSPHLCENKNTFLTLALIADVLKALPQAISQVSTTGDWIKGVMFLKTVSKWPSKYSLRFLYKVEFQKFFDSWKVLRDFGSSEKKLSSTTNLCLLGHMTPNLEQHVAHWIFQTSFGAQNFAYCEILRDCTFPKNF